MVHLLSAVLRYTSKDQTASLKHKYLQMNKEVPLSYPKWNTVDQQTIALTSLWTKPVHTSPMSPRYCIHFTITCCKYIHSTIKHYNNHLAQIVNLEQNNIRINHVVKAYRDTWIKPVYNVFCSACIISMPPSRQYL